MAPCSHISDVASCAQMCNNYSGYHEEASGGWRGTLCPYPSARLAACTAQWAPGRIQGNPNPASIPPKPFHPAALCTTCMQSPFTPQSQGEVTKCCFPRHPQFLRKTKNKAILDGGQVPRQRQPQPVWALSSSGFLLASAEPLAELEPCGDHGTMGRAGVASLLPCAPYALPSHQAGG